MSGRGEAKQNNTERNNVYKWENSVGMYPYKWDNRKNVLQVRQHNEKQYIWTNEKQYILINEKHCIHTKSWFHFLLAELLYHRYSFDFYLIFWRTSTQKTWIVWRETILIILWKVGGGMWNTACVDNSSQNSCKLFIWCEISIAWHTLKNIYIKLKKNLYQLLHPVQHRMLHNTEKSYLKAKSEAFRCWHMCSHVNTHWIENIPEDRSPHFHHLWVSPVLQPMPGSHNLQLAFPGYLKQRKAVRTTHKHVKSFANSFPSHTHWCMVSVLKWNMFFLVHVFMWVWQRYC